MTWPPPVSSELQHPSRLAVGHLVGPAAYVVFIVPIPFDAAQRDEPSVENSMQEEITPEPSMDT